MQLFLFSAKALCPIPQLCTGAWWGGGGVYDSQLSCVSAEMARDGWRQNTEEDSGLRCTSDFRIPGLARI